MKGQKKERVEKGTQDEKTDKLKQRKVCMEVREKKEKDG